MDDGETLQFPKAFGYFPEKSSPGGIDAVVKALCSSDSGAP